MTPNPQVNVDDLIRRIQARDQSALSELYQQYGGMVYGMALRVLQNTILAEEVTQDVFLKVWKQPENWDSQKGKLSTWLLTIARYTAIDRVRKEERRTPDMSIDLDTMLDLIGDEGVIRPDWVDSQLMRRLLAQLSDVQREAIDLAFFKGMTHDEIAIYLKTPLGTIKSRIRQGLMTLKQLWLDANKDEN